MRKCIGILLGLILAMGTVVWGQSDENPMGKLLSSKKYYRCVDYQYNATLIVPRLYQEGKIDSIYLVLDFVEKECEPTPRTGHTRLLLKIEEGKFSEDLYDSTILSDLMFYQQAMKSINLYGYEKSWYTYGADTAADRNFDNFFIDLAQRMYRKYPPGTLEHLLSGFYNGDFSYFFHELKTDAYAGTDLQEYYLTFLWDLEERYKNRGSHMAGLFGFWRPLGANGILGNKPELGFMMGGKWGRWQSDLTIIVRFMDAKEKYVYRYKGVFDTTDYFFGGYIGIDMGYELLTAGSHQFELLGGIGYDGFDTKSTENDDKSHSIGSLNLNIGFRHKLYISKYHDWYVGLQGRYNVVKYGTDGGSDLSGNTLAIQLLIGRLNNNTFRRYADGLGYFE